jgi:hypothetical protein
MDDYLIARAVESGRSVSEEIEARLERSFYMDGLLTTFAGMGAPLVNALTTAVAFSFLQDFTRQDRYKILQVATGYIIAVFGSSHNATLNLTPKVSEMLWPRRDTSDKYEVEGLKLATGVLSNLGSEMPEKQTEELCALFLEKAGWDGPSDAPPDSSVKQVAAMKDRAQRIKDNEAIHAQETAKPKDKGDD